MTDFGLETIRLKISKGDNLISPLVGSDTMINLGLGLLSSTVLYGRAGFSPASLFSSGEQGAWYDPSDFTTMFTDAAGTTPVTAVEQPVGLLLDKSKGGRQSLAVTGWTKDSGDGTVTVVGNTITITGATTTTRVDITAPGWAVGNYADITVTGSVAGATGATLFLGGGGVYSTLSGTNTFRNVIASNTVCRLQIATGSATYVVTSRGFVPGNHASQSTAASRPVLSARVNLLTQTEDFSNAVWAKDSLLAFGSGSTVNATTAPNGTVTADLITSANATAATGVSQTGLVMATASYTWSVCFKPNGARYVQLLWGGGASSNYANFDLQSTTYLPTAGTYTAATITPEANGFYRLSITSSVTAGTYGVYAWFVDSGTSGRGASFTGDGVKGAYVWGADLRVTNDGVNLPAYQRVAAATDYDTSGFPLYLKFDGTDDSLVTGSIDFSTTDKMTVVAGMRKLSTSVGVPTELSANVDTNDGAWNFACGPSVATSWYFSSGSTSQGQIFRIVVPYTPPITNVLSTVFDRSVTGGGQITARVNGEAPTSTSVTGSGSTGNFGNYPLYIGRRGGTTLSYNGNLYSLIVRGALSTDAQIASTETYVNNLTKAY